ncbi:PAS domain-containing protein [Nisaea acidiphila]|uniref:PAS domain-containing protein n=1 Tax=Nisaea acidiphila TaxID=1862145 RepID=A0A9J7AQD6_9PROT|nr:PAS domain-containing protein [Nisaea acidiphila]UUX49811.1 PAS domain-containing protein [Nisaea acidiphila]
MFPDRLFKLAPLISPEMDCTEVTSADQLERPELRELFRLWKSKAGDRTAPSRTDIDVIELKPWLPHILLVDLMEQQADVRFRVIGTWIAEQVGRDDTGKTISEIGGTDRGKRILEEYYLAAIRFAPYRSCGTFFASAGAKSHLQAERLILPLSEDGRRCNKILSAIYFLNTDL